MICHGFGPSRASKIMPWTCLILTIDFAFKSQVGIKIPPLQTISKPQNHQKTSGKVIKTGQLKIMKINRSSRLHILSTKLQRNACCSLKSSKTQGNLMKFNRCHNSIECQYFGCLSWSDFLHTCNGFSMVLLDDRSKMT